MFMGQRLTVRMVTLPELVYMVNATPFKIPAGSLAEIDKPNLKFIWKCRTRNSQNDLKREPSWRIHTFQCQILPQSYTFKTVQYW